MGILHVSELSPGMKFDSWQQSEQSNVTQTIEYAGHGVERLPDPTQDDTSTKSPSE